MKTWFITGTSRGFGRAWAIAALDRGDRVIATARNVEDIRDLEVLYEDHVLVLPLDVSDRDAAFAAVRQGHQHFGCLDIVVNNAGYGQVGAIEELSERELRDVVETMLLGALWVTQAALPIMRLQGSGHFLQVSSIGGVIAAPSLGAYHAAKWGLEGFSQALAAEVKDYGIKVTIIEPGGFATGFGVSVRQAQPLPAYDGLRAEVAKRRAAGAQAPGDPTASARAVLKIVDAEEPPLRVFFGAGLLKTAIDDYEQRIATWRAWEELSAQAQG